MREQLADDVDEGARRQREKQHGHGGGDHVVSKHRAEEGGSDADQPGKPEETPAGSLLSRERPDDAKALGGIVQAETDQKDARESELAGAGRLTNGQPFGEVMQPDAGRDEQRQL